jgi:hypothetical protein
MRQVFRAAFFFTGSLNQELNKQKQKQPVKVFRVLAATVSENVSVVYFY